jgi:hypothetical protein
MTQAYDPTIESLSRRCELEGFIVHMWPSTTNIFLQLVWAGRLAAFAQAAPNGQLQLVKTESHCPEFFPDEKFLMIFPQIHWYANANWTQLCGLCRNERYKGCRQCSNRRWDLIDLATKARQARLHSLISADCAGLVMGQLAAIAAGIMWEMPGLLD